MICPTPEAIWRTPILYATAAMKKAKIRFMITPAEMMAMRLGTLMARKLRGS